MTHEEYLVVFITVQNLVGIGTVVLKTCSRFNIMLVWLKNDYSRPFRGVFWGKIGVKAIFFYSFILVGMQ